MTAADGAIDSSVKTMLCRSAPLVDFPHRGMLIVSHATPAALKLHTPVTTHREFERQT